MAVSVSSGGAIPTTLTDCGWETSRHGSSAGVSAGAHADSVAMFTSLWSQSMTEPLSPAAQAVLNAAEAVSEYGKATPLMKARLAAALRAAADQVVPEEPLYGGDQRWMYERDTRQESRTQLLAIAAELESQ